MILSKNTLTEPHLEWTYDFFPAHPTSNTHEKAQHSVLENPAVSPSDVADMLGKFFLKYSYRRWYGP